MIFDKRKVNEINPWAMLAACLEALFHMIVQKRKPRHGLAWVKQRLGFGGDKTAKICRAEYHTEESYEDKLFI